jgi:hypothetical protein
MATRSALVAFLISLAAGQTPVTFTNIQRSDRSGIESAREVTVQTRPEWAVLWDQHAKGRPLPDVDFTREAVIGVFLGSRPTTGYSAEITSIEKEGTDLVVSYREQRPSPELVVLQVLTFPCHLVKIARPEGAVRFRRTPLPR